MKQKPRPTNHAAGLAAETMASLLLRLKGYNILCVRYKTPVGEIDLIAKRGRTVAFIEVKRRATLPEALAAVSPAMRGRIERAAGHFIAHHPHFAGCAWRFDLIAMAPPFHLRHLDNAWRPSS